ncbi:unnamed protein product [Angiostrongylus costaricensis]|uniref:alpha-L-fucosidase n=1 Tax=Angiostrongylus costaricensis TaxID=334426 RepID=A0A0R3PW59_ANGCS|nr:unnamed protein product [Angiostrongylus costaricensis]
MRTGAFTFTLWITIITAKYQSTDVNTVHILIEQLARTISCGGNFLLNIGPDMHGKIPAIFEDRLRELGRLLLFSCHFFICRFINVNSEAIYNTKPWIYQNDTGNVWYTSKLNSSKLRFDRLFNPQMEGSTIIYAWILNMPTTDLKLKRVKTTNTTLVSFLGTNVSYTPGSMSSLVIPFSRIPWRLLIRNDVMILKIQSAATQRHTPLVAGGHRKSKTLLGYADDFNWVYNAF